MTTTKIEWASKVWNPLAGCSLASPGCTNCYAMKMAGRLEAMGMPQYQGTTQKTKAGFVWTGQVNAAPESILTAPLRQKKPTDYFVNSMSDLFHPAVPDALIDRVFAVMALCPQHVFKILTKRPERMREYFRESTGWRARIAGLLNELKPSAAWNGTVYQGWQNLHGRPDGLPNVWLGTSVEDQPRADERIPHLLATPAALRFLSMEPLLASVDLTDFCTGFYFTNPLTGRRYHDAPDDHPSASDNLGARIDWVIVGGESGPGARPMHPDWARSLRDQCAAAGVPFFFKQWGDWAKHPTGQPVTIRQHHASIGYIDADTGERKRHPSRCTDETMRRIGKKAAGRLLDGREHSEFPSTSARGVGSAGEPA